MLFYREHIALPSKMWYSSGNKTVRTLLHKQKQTQEGYTMNGIGYCGLACCVCSQNTTCPGCQAGGCDIHGWCKNYNCCREKGLRACWECNAFPCSGGMLDNRRTRTFARFAKENGANELERCLISNTAKGILYHHPGQHTGDYDLCTSEEQIMEMIKTGKKL